MDISTETTAFRELIESAQTVVIILPDTASRDAVATALSLSLTLRGLQKSVIVAYPKPPIVGWSHLVGVNKMVQQLGNKNFVISLDYSEGAIEKVSYNIEGNKFNLVIEPRPGAPAINESSVSYSYAGMASDLFLVIEAASLEALGGYYADNRQLFAEKPIVAIDNRPRSAQFGKLNIVRPAASISEIIAHMIRVGEFPMDTDIASNLFDGISVASRNFSSPQVNADTFEAAAYLLRQGARRATFAPRKQEEVPQREVVVQKPEGQQPPPDWLKPKIYKGSQLL